MNNFTKQNSSNVDLVKLLLGINDAYIRPNWEHLLQLPHIFTLIVLTSSIQKKI